MLLCLAVLFLNMVDGHVWVSIARTVSGMALNWPVTMVYVCGMRVSRSLGWISGLGSRTLHEVGQWMDVCRIPSFSLLFAYALYALDGWLDVCCVACVVCSGCMCCLFPFSFFLVPFRCVFSLPSPPCKQRTSFLFFSFLDHIHLVLFQFSFHFPLPLSPFVLFFTTSTHKPISYNV